MGLLSASDKHEGRCGYSIRNEKETGSDEVREMRRARPCDVCIHQGRNLACVLENSLKILSRAVMCSVSGSKALSGRCVEGEWARAGCKGKVT